MAPGKRTRTQSIAPRSQAGPASRVAHNQERVRQDTDRSASSTASRGPGVEYAEESLLWHVNPFADPMASGSAAAPMCPVPAGMGSVWDALAPGETSEAVHFLARVDAPRGVHVRNQPGGAKDGPVLPFDTLVAVERKTERGWYYVVSLGDSKQGSTPSAAGFIEGYHVASHPPEPSAHLYLVSPNDKLAEIAEKFYGHGFAWGHDARLYVQAIYHANQKRDVVYRQNADLSVDRRALDTSDRQKALELWRTARVVAGQALWMPSESFVQALKASGAIHHASLTRGLWEGAAGAMQGVVDAAQFTGGFMVGLLEGAWGALEDLFMGLADLIRAVWAVARVLAGDYERLRRFARKLGELWKNQDALETRMASDFLARWEAADDWDRGNFQGEVLGYTMMLAFITLVTLGAGTTVAGAGRFGHFIRLIQVMDATGDITTYAGAMMRSLKMPGHVLEESAEVLGKKTLKVEAGGKTRRGKRAATAVDEAGELADAAPHAHNHGGPYGDPRETPELPRRYLDRRELAPVRKLDARKSWKEAEKAARKSEKSIALGKKIESAEEGHEILERLARGDASALKKLGIDDYPADLDPVGREWALVQARDGFVIYSGSYGAVELPSDVRVLAHNHPGPVPSAKLGNKRPTIDLPVPERSSGLTYDEIIGDPNIALESGIIPSAPDVHAISEGTSHVIYTRYVHRGGGKIDNPVDGDTGVRIALYLSDTKVVQWNQRTKEYWYVVDVAVKDSAGNPLWRGKMYARWSAQAKSGSIHVHKPAQLHRPPQPGWQEA